MTLPVTDHRCIHVTRKGNRCRNPKVRDSNFCFYHSKRPGKLIAMGEILKNRDRLDTAEGIHDFLSRTLQALAASEIPPRQATALCYVAQTMLSSLSRVREERIAIHTRKEFEAIKEAVIVDATIDAELGLGKYAEMPADEAARAAVAAAEASMKKGAKPSAPSDAPAEDSAA